MTGAPDWLRRTSVVLVLIIGLALRLGFLTTAGESSLVTIVPDDAFYYFKTARNLVAGNGLSFDGLHATNGFHPLWMAVVVLLAGLTSEPLALVRVALALGVVLSSLTALLLYWMLRRATDLWYVPVLMVILYFLNRRAVVSSVNGLETSLSTFLFTLVLFLLLNEAKRGPHALREAPRHTECGGYFGRRGTAQAVLAALLALLFLARTDNAFFVAAFYVAAVALAEKGRRLRQAAVLAAVIAALTAPWLAWNWARFGSPVQVSGLSVPHVLQERYRLEGHGTIDMVARGLKMFLVVLYEGLRGEIGYARPVSGALILFSLAVFAVGWWRKTCEPGLRRSVLVLLALCVGSLAHVFCHTALRWYPRPWYFDQLLVLLPLMFGLALGVFDPRRALARFSHALRLWLLAAALLVVVAVQTACSVRTLIAGDWPWAKEMLDAAHWLRDNTAEDEVAAAFNAGIIGYYSDRRVVNLDGAINNAAFEAIRRRELLRHMREASVRYYLDFEPLMLDTYEPFLGDLRDEVDMPVVAEIDRRDVHWQRRHIKIHRLEWRKLRTRHVPRSSAPPR